MKVKDCILTRSIGMTGGASSTAALLAGSCSASTLAMPSDRPIANRAIVCRMIVFSLASIANQCVYVHVPRSSTYSCSVANSTNESSWRT
ncbi:unnamed protein product [Sphagnum jensenii]|uniref:Secreted protein n=2 Tax=Sphagnum jensenii TaxID=128206 RepID=A0ABP0VF98_9BRYO